MLFALSSHLFIIINIKMSSEEEFIINPTTNRPIKVHGRVYRQLKRQGLVESTLNNGNVESTPNKAVRSTIDPRKLIQKEDLEAALDRLLQEKDEEDVSIEYY